MRRRAGTFGIFLLLLGAALFLKGAWDWREEAWILWSGEVAEGTIVSRDQIVDATGATRYQLTVDLTLGTEVERRTFTVARQAFEKDSPRVTARYLAGDRNSLRLSGEEMRPNDALVLGLMVSILGGLIWATAVLRRRQARELGEALPGPGPEQAGEPGEAGGESG